VQCEDYKSRCQVSSNDLAWNITANTCEEAADCFCSNTDSVEYVPSPHNPGYSETVGLYNECKCNYWLRRCEDTRKETTCLNAVLYCCGDYGFSDSDNETSYFLNSPLCYCDFVNYVQSGNDFLNSCGQGNWDSLIEDEKKSLQAMYNEMNGLNWTNKNGWMTEWSGHCQWYGISCDNEGYVTSINLRNNNLEGQFPVYTRKVNVWGEPILDNDWSWSKYGLANLYKLKTLDLSNNKLTGTIEYLPLYNLYSVTQFNVSGNQLNGEVDALVAPSLMYADFSNNKFTSMRRFEKYKLSSFQSLRYCDVSNNAI